MDPDRWHLVTSIFDRALDVDRAQRDAFLDEACGDDAEVRAEVEALLVADDTPGDLIAGIVGEAATSAVTREGQLIGRYRVVREHGRGGMGSIYEAERADGTFDQTVALKVLQGVGAPDVVVQRFEQERQILARLEHPHIARLLDGGVTPDGQPFFAMELVDGKPIDRYCDERRLTVDERLALFLDVCSAVAYAHSNLVVHRDLKPDNILTTPDGQVRLLDFGIAKVLDDQSQNLTRTSVWAFTPSYASPEQVSGDPVGVGSDVYSLGVVLYELLTGARPYTIDARRPTEVERIVCGIDPVRPSTRVTEAGDEPIGRPRRGPEDRRLSRRLSGDLDVIIMKALRKEPDQRYASVLAFAEDVERHLDGRPVRARPATLRYRLGKGIRRNRWAVGAAAAVILTATTLVGFYTAQLAVERDLAQREADKATEVADFLQGLFEVSDPDESLGETITARELLDTGAEQLDALAGQPTVHATMLKVVGDVYVGLGLTGEAAPLLQRAIDVGEEAFGPQSDEVAYAQMSLASTLQSEGEIEAARLLFDSAIETFRVLHGEESLPFADAIRQRAYWFETDGDYERAEAEYRGALALYRIAAPVDDPEAVATIGALGNLLRQLDRLDEAEPLLREALDAERALYGDRHPDVASTARTLAALLRDQRQYEESETLYLEVIDIRRELLGDRHPEVATTLNSYALLLTRLGRTGEAIAVTEEVIDIQAENYGGPHPSVAAGYHNLATMLSEAGRLEEAADLFRQSIDMQDIVFREDHPNRAFPRIGLATVLRDLGVPGQAEPLLREALAVRREALPPTHRYIGEALSDLGATLIDLGRLAEAEALLLEALDVLQAAEDDGRTGMARNRLVRLYTAAGRPTDADRYRGEGD